jgi:anaerobic magnesium-protoporphyrin IX monomethyl ester cyclase
MMILNEEQLALHLSKYSMKPRILLVYPNLPLMMSPAMSMAILNTICKSNGCEVEIFETTQYSSEFSNKHIRQSEIGAVRANKDDEVKDMFYVADPSRILPDFISHVERYNPDMIMMSVQEDVYRMALQLLDSIKEKKIPNLLGGVLVMSDPTLVITDPLVNQVCVYEGERVAEDIVKCLHTNETTKYVRGTWYKDDEGITKNKPQQLTDIAKVIPDYTCFDIKRWNRPMGGRTFNAAVSMETYRGCPYNCTYCNSPNTRDIANVFEIGNFMRRKHASVVANELENFKELYNPDLIMIQDDSFLARPGKEIFEFCNMWSKYKIPFWMNTRIENCRPEYLSALKEAGIYRISLGIESGNAEYRENVLKRKVKNTKYQEFLGYINDSNIAYGLNVIVGMPYETRDMIMETARMVRDARGYDGINISIFQPYRGTQLRRVAVEAGFMNKDHINGWDSGAIGGGFMDSWALTMPKPYIQADELQGVTKCFALYAFFEDARWSEIYEAETNEELRKQLMQEYTKAFFEPYQQGGADRIQKFCAMHDHSSSYQWEVA